MAPPETLRDQIVGSLPQSHQFWSY
jgi:hypothetical protein